MNDARERSLKDRVRQIAKQQNRLFNDVWKKLVLERFLVRLSLSPYHQQLVFKGGMLLSHYLSIGRETIDLDFLLKGLEAEEERLLSIIKEIASIPLTDGFVFDSISIEERRHIQTPYPGFNLGLSARCGQTSTKITLDIGIGDVVNAQRIPIGLTKTEKGPIFESEVSLEAYPIEYIFAEKLETACFRGSDNSRMKDFHDLWMMIQEKDLLNVDSLRNVVRQTFAHRKTPLEAIPTYVGDDAERLSQQWNRHLRSLGDSSVTQLLPDSLEEIVNTINSWLKKYLEVS